MKEEVHMKIKDLAAELNLTGKEVLEKAKSMNISVSKNTPNAFFFMILSKEKTCFFPLFKKK